MKVAIILTGALRTIKKTIPYFKKHLLLQPTDIYICVQNDTQESEETWNAWFKEELGKEELGKEELGKEELCKKNIDIKSITWFSLYRIGLDTENYYYRICGLIKHGRIIFVVVDL